MFRLKQIFIISLLFISMIGKVYSSEEHLQELIQNANQLFDEKKIKEALKLYEQALKEKPKEPVFFYNKGNVYFEMGEFEKAMVDYEEGISLKPKKHLLRNLHFHLANALTQKSKSLVDHDYQNQENIFFENVLELINQTKPIVAQQNNEVVSSLLSNIENACRAKDLSKINEYKESLANLINQLPQDLSNQLNPVIALIEAKQKAMTVDEINKQKMINYREAIGNLEKSFLHYRFSMEEARKIGDEEKLEYERVGRSIKNNWAIARELWSMTHEKLKKLEKESLTLRDGIAQLLALQESLYQKLYQIHLNTHSNDVMSHQLKVLAEYHLDNKEDLPHLITLAEKEYQEKEIELSNLNNLIKQQAQRSQPAEKTKEHLELEKKVSSLQKVIDSLQSLVGAETFVIEGLKKDDLLTSRQYSYQMMMILKTIQHYFDQKDILKNTLEEYVLKTSKIDTEMLRDKDNSKKFEWAKDEIFDAIFLQKRISELLENFLNLKEDFFAKQENESDVRMKFYQQTAKKYMMAQLSKLKEDILVDQKILAEQAPNENRWKSQIKNNAISIQKQYDDLYRMFVDQLFFLIDKIDNNTLDEWDNIISPEVVLFHSKLIHFFDELNSLQEESLNQWKIGLISIKQNVINSLELSKDLSSIEANDEVKKQNYESLKNNLFQLALFLDSTKTINLQFHRLTKLHNNMKNQIKEDQFESINIAQLDTITSLESLLGGYISSLNLQLTQTGTSSQNDSSMIKEHMQDLKLSSQQILSYRNHLENIKNSTKELSSSLAEIQSLQLQLAQAYFNQEPKEAKSTIAFALKLQQMYQEFVNKGVQSNWAMSTADEVWQELKDHQQMNMELIGLRALDQVNQLAQQQDHSSSPASPLGLPGSLPPGAGHGPHQGQNSQGVSQEIIDEVKSLLQASLTECDKIQSFYAVKELGNSLPAHEEVINKLKEALKKLEDDQKSDENKEQNKEQNQDQQNQQNSEQQEQNQDNNNKGQGQSESASQPLKLTPEEAKRLLKELNEKDQKINADKKPNKRPANVPRPW